jgi:hypothetical protein
VEQETSARLSRIDKLERALRAVVSLGLCIHVTVPERLVGDPTWGKLAEDACLLKMAVKAADEALR